LTRTESGAEACRYDNEKEILCLRDDKYMGGHEERIKVVREAPKLKGRAGKLLGEINGLP
jgi:hypothetical protein